MALGTFISGSLTQEVFQGTVGNTVTGNLATTGSLEVATTSQFDGNVTLVDGITITNSANTTGTSLWGASDKGAFFGATPIAIPANTVDYVTALVNLGLRASGGTAAATFPGIVSVGTQLVRSRQNTAVAAAGTNVGTATALGSADMTKVSSDGSGKGWILPTGVVGAAKIVINTTSTAGILYPATGGTINGLSANAGIVIGASKTTFLECTLADTWWASEMATNAAA